VAEAYKSTGNTSRSTAAATSGTAAAAGGTAAAASGTAAQGRELRAQGRKTMAKLLEAGMRVFAERGFHAARVDDIVRAARASHGTFYLYFSSKEDLLRSLAVQCSEQMEELATTLGEIGPDEDGWDELRRFLDDFLSTYARYGPVIRAWMEDHVDDREVNRVGVGAFTTIATTLGQRMRAAGAPGGAAPVAALMALLERFAYFRASRRLDFDEEVMLDTLTSLLHRGFFGAPVLAS
jgi:AcrR family transcriptional regulator